MGRATAGESDAGEEWLRVLHVINDLRVGGAERLLFDLTPHLADQGVDVQILTLGRFDSYLERAMQERSARIPLHLPPAPLGLYDFRRQLPRLMRALRECDIVHVHLFPAQFWVALAAALLPPRQRPVLITTEHNTYNRRRKPLFRPVDAAMYGRYDHIIVISDATEATLGAWAPGVRRRFHLIHNGVDVDRFARALPASKQKTLGVPEATFVLACVGRYEPQKDHATLVRALTHLPDVHAALIGDGVLREEIAAQAAEAGVADRVHLMGRRDDVPNLVQMADVYVQPSRFEGWSLAVLEAMASGHAPLVATDAPGLADAVRGRGLLVPIGDAPALAAAIERLRTDRALAANLTTTARQWVEGFRIEQCAAEYVALYRVAQEQRGRN